MKPLSIRNRLMLAAAIIVAAGLLVADSATYVLLRSSLLGRIDQQLRGARFVAASLFERHPFSGFDGGPGHGGESAPVTLAQWLDPSGHILETRTFGLSSRSASLVLPPDLPGSSAVSSSQPIRIFTTRSTGTGARYRVLANAVEEGGTVVLALPLGDAEETLHHLLLVEAIVTIAVLGALAVISQWAVRAGLRPLERMEAAAAGIAAGDLSRRVEPAEPTTEVGRLGLALNEMLARIETAFTERRAAEAKLRRFIADASHELRTPLTSIRGYAELFRRGAAENPQDLEKSMRRIEDESSRMGQLVEELLLLARLDQGRPLERAPVDLVQLASDAVEDARTIDTARPITFASEGEAIVEGDDARLRQVVANLLSNALEHTPAGTPVRVNVSVADKRARLEVADEGPGIISEDIPRIFDRFYRVDPARARETGGVGLGLAIVKAIVEAHGGSVEVRSAPGEGARFIAELPLSPANQKEAPHGDDAPDRLDDPERPGA